jgi:hypothetical protein
MVTLPEEIDLNNYAATFRRICSARWAPPA